MAPFGEGELEVTIEGWGLLVQGLMKTDRLLLRKKISPHKNNNHAN